MGIAEQTAVGGMNLLRSAGPRTNPNNLLAGGRVISERVVDINELLATGKLIEAPAVRDQAFRASAPMVSGFAAGPIATTAVMTAPEYAVLCGASRRGVCPVMSARQVSGSSGEPLAVYKWCRHGCDHTRCAGSVTQPRNFDCNNLPWREE